MPRHAPNETTDGVLGYFLTDLDQGITELLDSLRCNLAVSDEPKHNVPEVFYWILVRRAWTHSINSFILQELPTYSRNMRQGIIVHQEEPRTHCISVGSDKGSKDFIPIPNGSQGLACRCLCVPPWIDLPRPPLTHHQTGHAEQCDHILHSFSRRFHVCLMCSGWTCEKHRVPVAELPILVFSGKCQSSSTVPGSEHRAH